MKSLLSVLLIITVLALDEGLAQGQQSAKIPRIGVLSSGSASSRRAKKSFREIFEGLRDLGYTEGKNIVIEYRYADRKLDRLTHLATELVRLKVALIVAIGATTIGYAIKATKTVPIVMVGGGDAVSRGYVKSLAQPGGNVTGLSSYLEGQEAKRMELLKETLPAISRVAVLNSRKTKRAVGEYQRAGKALGMDVQVVNFQKAEEIENALSKIVAIHPDALIVISHTFTLRNGKKIVQFSLKNRIPALFPRKRFVRAGGLMSYHVNRLAMYRRTATYVDKILKGANPAILPVEPPQLELVINLKTARQIGVKIPPEILLEANEVIK